jgi:pyruvate dehydrogenase E2 component (dihydrolipoamide acetyltransferase)
MPALSPTMETGNLVEWKVAEGQEITAGDVLAEVETDKATLSWENQDDGIVAKLLVAAGAQGIQVGTPVAILVEDAEHVEAFKSYSTADGAAGGSGAKADAPATDSQASTAGDQQTDAPAVAVSSKIGPAARTWLAESGLSISSLAPTGPGGIVTKGDVLAAIAAGVKPSVEAQEAAPSPTKAPPKQEQKPDSRERGGTEAPPAPPQQQQQQQQQQRRQQQAQRPASARRGRNADGSPTYTDIPNSQIRRIIAQRLTESKTTIPHIFFTAEVELDGIAPLREALKSQGAKVSVNDCVIKAAALALAQVPGANAKWDASAEATAPSDGVDVSVAVATEGGLITPIVKNADQKALRDIAAEVRELAAKARANKLKPEEFQGGSFSISNLGMFGVDSFSAIINPPQACIMAVGGARKVARPGTDGSPVAATFMTVTLSADARVYDAEVASALLQNFAANMANPYRLLA